MYAHIDLHHTDGKASIEATCRAWSSSNANKERVEQTDASPWTVSGVFFWRAQPLSSVPSKRTFILYLVIPAMTLADPAILPSCPATQRLSDTD